MGWTRGSLGNSSSLEAVAEVASALLDTCHDQACVSFGKRLEIHFVGHVLRLASTLRVYKKERRARFFLSPSSSPLQEVCSPQLTTDGSRRKKIRRRWRRHVRSISMQGRTTDTKKQSRRERERGRSSTASRQRERIRPQSAYTRRAHDWICQFVYV